MLASFQSPFVKTKDNGQRNGSKSTDEQLECVKKRDQKIDDGYFDTAIRP